MPGQKEFQKVTSISANPFVRIRSVDLSFATPIAAGASNYIYLLSPAGYVSEIMQIELNYPNIAAAASGSKVIGLGCANGNIICIYGVGNWNLDVTYAGGQLKNVDPGMQPQDLTAQYLAQKLTFDEVNGARVMFQNLTPVADGGVTKALRVWIKDQKIT